MQLSEHESNFEMIISHLKVFIISFVATILFLSPVIFLAPISRTGYAPICASLFVPADL